MRQRLVVQVLRKYDPTEWGGTETHVVEMVKRLAQRDFSLEVHAPFGPTQPDRMLPATVPLVRYHAFTPFIGSSMRRRALVANAGNIASLDEPLRLYRNRNIDLCHVHTMGRIGGAVRTAMIRSGRPYVVSVHGPLFAPGAMEASGTHAVQRGVWDLGRPLGWLLGSRRVLHDATRVIVFNDDEQHELGKRIDPTRVVRMDHGIEWRRFTTGDALRAKGRWLELGDAPVVSMIARVCRQKNQLLAVRAFASGAPPDHRLVLAGAQVEPDYKQLVEDEARALGVAERVHLLGNLEPEAVPDLLERSTLVLFSSSWESFGLAVAEAWSASRAVLFCRKFGLGDLARATDTPALDDFEVPTWAAALRRLLADPEERAAAARAGHTAVLKRYDIDVVAARLSDLYREILDETKAPGRISSGQTPA